MTDPVPYQPSENIPPVVLWRQVTPGMTPGPFNAVEVPPAQSSITFTVPIREYNLDDQIDCRVFIDVTSDDPGPDVECASLPPSGSRDREVTFTVSTTAGPIGREPTKCHKVMVVISDRGWRSFLDVPVDGDGRPVTAPAFVQWLVWVDDEAAERTAQIANCAAVMFPE
ncbi:MAG: hypothetical protein QME96_00015 [Myxococcota bacterium]|nr:hypothetical protein [Myxococcota bacterium]